MQLAFLSDRTFFIVAILLLASCLFYVLFFIMKNRKQILRLTEEITGYENDTEDILYRDEVFGLSSVMGTREYQQDRVGGKAFSGDNAADVFAIVCDGMGGMENGELASDYSSKTILSDIQRDKPNWTDMPSYLYREVKNVNNAVRTLSDENGNRIKSGSTLAAAVVKGCRMYWISVGDSRIYAFQNGKVKQITRDQNLEMQLREKVASGEMTQEEMNREKRKDALISYIGMKENILIDQNMEPLNLYPGGMVLLCSDGVTKLLSDAEIADVLEKNQSQPAKEIAQKITDAATRKRRRSQDNTSAIIVKILPREAK